MPIPTPQETRPPSLEPFIERVGAFIRVVGEGDLPLEIPFGPKPLQLSASERRAVWCLLGDGSLPWTDWQAWIGLGTALHLAAASVHDAVALEPDARAKARRLAAVGEVSATVMEGLRQALAGMVLEGQADEARRLAEFRNKLFATLAPLRAVTVSEAPAPVPGQPAEPAKEDAASALPPRFEASDPALASVLERAGAFLRARGNESRPLEVSFGGRLFSLGTWERAVAWRSLCEGAWPASPWHQLLVEGLALRLALLLALEECDRAGAPGAVGGPVRGELQVGVALAGGVVERMRVELERLVVGGQSDDARRLTAFRNGLTETVRDARRALSDEPPAPQGDDQDPGSDAVGSGAGTDLEGRLRPYLERAGDQLRLRGRENKPITIPVGGLPWRLSAWERLVLWKTLCEEGPPPPPWAQALAAAAAAQLGVLEALHALGRAGSDGDARGRAEAAHAQALALAGETAEVLGSIATESARDGKGELAAQLRSFQDKVGETSRLRPRS